MKITKGLPFPCPQHQPDAVISQANPVSGTLYTVLATTANVKIISIATNITWAVTQPTPLRVVVTIDGQSIPFNQDNPASASGYVAVFDANNPVQGFYVFQTSQDWSQFSQPLLEGRVVKIEAIVTWAVTQPTPLVCRVKWARW